MKCKNIQDIILTDYLDGRMDAAQRVQLEEHLLRCSHCRAFAAVAQKTVVAPFATVTREKPPQKIWENISETIREERQKNGSLFTGFIEHVRALFIFPRTTFALASAFSIILIAVLFVKTPMYKNEKIFVANNGEQQIDEFVQTMSYTDITVNGETAGYGTVIEEYFM